jgi:hypothetical protein
MPYLLKYTDVRIDLFLEMGALILDCGEIGGKEVPFPLNDVASSIDLVLKVLLQDQHFYDL